MELELDLRSMDNDHHDNTDGKDFPYVIERFFGGAFLKRSVVLTEMSPPNPKKMTFYIDEPEAFVRGRLTPAAREKFIDAVSSAAKDTNHRMCAVFSPRESVYCEPDGTRKESTDIPQGGFLFTSSDESAGSNGLDDGEIHYKSKGLILIVDHESAVTQTCGDYLKKAGFTTITASCAEDALNILDRADLDIVMTDFIMPGIDGGVLTGMIKEKYSADVILMTGYKPNCSFEEAKSLGASDFFYKPFKLKELLDSVTNIMKTRTPQ